MKILTVSVILCAAVLILSGCLLFASDAPDKSYDTIRFDGRDYTACGNTILLNSRGPGASSWEDMTKTLLTKIGDTDGSAVYAIDGLDSAGWLYCDFQPMLGNGPRGVYHAADVAMDTVKDFKPDALEVYALTKPTSTASGTESLYASTTDQRAVDGIVTSILDGKALTPEAFQEAQAKDWSYGNAQQYRLEFSSEAFPNLLYLYDYTVGNDGMCAILSDKAGYETDAGLLKLLENNEKERLRAPLPSLRAY